ncbi:MAG: thiamine pyrophosphate-binding protein, partial [Muribaculaceae bacterium]
AEKDLAALAEKADIPVATTLLGLSCISSNHRLNKGMIGMHGNVACNIATTNCDVLIAIGMRFSDRVTGDIARFAPQAKVIHIDIDKSELDKTIPTTVGLNGDAKTTLQQLLPFIRTAHHDDWIRSFDDDWELEREKIINKEINPDDGVITMGQVVNKVTEATGNQAVLVTDVGQNQMQAARYFRYTRPRSIITSGGQGTMGFGLPAAIGAKIAAPDRTVCLFAGDGGLQMTIEELGVILQYNVDVKIILLNNNFLGMVRQWQELFYNERYSETPLVNPNFVMIANAYGIPAENVETPDQLDEAIERMVKHDGAYLLNVNINPSELVYPMVPSGSVLDNILLSKTEKYIKKQKTDYDKL